jgi:hypothetical protein
MSKSSRSSSSDTRSLLIDWLCIIAIILCWAIFSLREIEASIARYSAEYYTTWFGTPNPNPKPAPYHGWFIRLDTSESPEVSEESEESDVSDRHLKQSR